MTMSPTEPTAEELAAIMAALELVWPRPVVVAAAGSADDLNHGRNQTGLGADAWRWSGRWWGTRPVAASRNRPLAG